MVECVPTLFGPQTGVHIERYEEEVLTPARINLRIRIRFVTGSLLEINEAVIVEAGKLRHLSYRYHAQDKQNALIFRYDNAPHFPAIPDSPHHKHVPDGVVSSQQPSVIAVIRETENLTEECKE